MMSLSPCPDENLMAAWAVGSVSGIEAEAVSTHVDGCAACRAAFSAVVATPLDVTHPRAVKLISYDSPFAVGEVVLGKYRVEGDIGAGGMGLVLRARHLSLNSDVALKLIRPELAHDKDIVSRFSREARSAVRLKTQHVCRVLDLEMLPDGQPMMVMEFLEGETLEARLARSKLSVGEVIGWVRQALEGLAEAHAAGIVHRDLKPANLFLHRGGGREVLKILDFGIAKSVHPDIELGLQQTSQRMLIGSPAFMSPEQLLPGADIDARSDVWSVGCTMHALLSGAPPFKGSDLVELAWQVRHAPIPRLEAPVPPALAAIVLRCLERDVANRFTSVAELDAALAAVNLSESQRVAAQAVTARGSVLPVALAVVGGMLLAGVAGFFIVSQATQGATPANVPAPIAAVVEKKPATLVVPAAAPVTEAAAEPAPAPLIVEPPPVLAPSEPLAPLAPEHGLAPGAAKKATHARPRPSRPDAGEDIFRDRI